MTIYYWMGVVTLNRVWAMQGNFLGETQRGQLIVKKQKAFIFAGNRGGISFCIEEKCQISHHQAIDNIQRLQLTSLIFTGVPHEWHIFFLY